MSLPDDGPEHRRPAPAPGQGSPDGDQVQPTGAPPGERPALLGALEAISKDFPPRNCQRKKCHAAAPELRRCTGNGGVLWACSRCGHTLSNWIPRARLQGIDLEALPSHITRAEKRMVRAWRARP
jgi:hypothetical protein